MTVLIFLTSNKGKGVGQGNCVKGRWDLSLDRARNRPLLLLEAVTVRTMLSRAVPLSARDTHIYISCSFPRIRVFQRLKELTFQSSHSYLDLHVELSEVENPFRV